MPPGFIVENVIDQSVIVQSGFRRDIESLALLMRVFCLCLAHASPYVSWLADNQNSISIAMGGDAARLGRAGTTDAVATRGSGGLCRTIVCLYGIAYELSCRLGSLEGLHGHAKICTSCVFAFSSASSLMWRRLAVGRAHGAFS